MHKIENIEIKTHKPQLTQDISSETLLGEKPTRRGGALLSFSKYKMVVSTKKYGLWSVGYYSA